MSRSIIEVSRNQRCAPRIRLHSRPVRFLSSVLLVVALGPHRGNATEPSIAKAHRFDPVVQEIEGWSVHVDPALLSGDGADDDDRSLAMLANHLQRIAILVPPESLAKLRKVEIWIERDHPVLGAMQYHPSRGWLLANDHDERLTKKVHSPHADQLLSNEQMLKHPAVILHELAHGFHDQFLDFDHPEVIAAFENAKESKRYEQVLLYTGQKVRHYGLSNHKEYFAEGTEAYFYRNDFYPFVRAELKDHDPELHDLLKRLWRD
ncbi:MAG: metallopeptidase [Pirellulaceae bacterium]